MSMSAFAHGTTAAAGGGLTANLVSFDAFDFSISPATATAGVRLLSTGAQQRLQDTTYATQTTWLTSGANTDFQVLCTVNSGSLTSGTTGSWLALSTSREWYVRTAFAFDFQLANITLQIRLAASPFTVLASSTHVLDAQTEI